MIAIENPILKRHLKRTKANPQQFFILASIITLLFLIISTVYIHNLSAHSNTTLLGLSFVLTIGLALWLTVTTAIFILVDVNSEQTELVRATPLLPTTVIWAYVASALYIQRWVVLIFAYLISLMMAVRILVLPVDIQPQIINLVSRLDETGSPSPLIIGLILMAGMLAGFGLCILLVAGSITGTLRVRSVVFPVLQSMASYMIALIMLLGWSSTLAQQTTSPLPIFFSIILCSIPFAMGIQIANWWKISLAVIWSAFAMIPVMLTWAVMLCVFLIPITIIAVVKDVSQVDSDIIFFGGFCIGFFLLLGGRIYEHWREATGLQSLVVFLWLLLVVGFFVVSYLIDERMPHTRWWLITTTLILTIYGLGFFHINTAAVRLWRDD